MYKMEIELNSAISFIDRPNLDSLLYYLAFKDKFGYVENYQYLSDKERKEKDNELYIPLKKDKRGFYLSSSMFILTDKYFNYTDSLKKKWDDKYDFFIDFQGKRRQIKTNSGRYKQYDIPFNLYSIDKVYFIFDVNESKDIDIISRLFESCYGIGKYVKLGYGEKGKVTIEKCKSIDIDEYIYRPVPVRLVNTSIKKQHKIKLNGWSLPYWDHSRWESCYVPDYDKFDIGGELCIG